MINLIADILLASGALGVGIYCFVLGRRLKKFNDLESGVGGAVATMSLQVHDMTKTMEKTQKLGAKSEESLLQLTNRAEDLAQRLELLIASLHDVPNSTEERENGIKEKRTQTPNDLSQGEFETPLFVRHNRV